MFQHMHRPFMKILVLTTSLAWTPFPAISKPLEGVGELKFGMTSETVDALPGCSSSVECLYELMGKNRYFRLSYGATSPSQETAQAHPTVKGSTLRTIEVDMGNYTSEWFLELFEVLQSQYALAHSPTDQENALFQKGQHSELIIGFADGHVLLKIVRRTFGNLIIRVVFQDAVSASLIQHSWVLSPSPAVSLP